MLTGLSRSSVHGPVVHVATRLPQRLLYKQQVGSVHAAEPRPAFCLLQGILEP